MLLLIIMVSVLVLVEIHLSLTKGNEVVLVFIKKTMVELLCLSMFDRLLNSKGFLFACSVILHGSSHRLSLFRFETVLHKFEIVFAANSLTNEYTDIK